jgi:hypothetical protein
MNYIDIEQNFQNDTLCYQHQQIIIEIMIVKVITKIIVAIFDIRKCNFKRVHLK